jgi:SAM-dependent methyltransferase
MNDAWKERWEERYRADTFAYGEAPNNYLKEQLEHLKPGSILFPAEGEGRNAVFAARLGWTVSAFDISAEGWKKALRLAEAQQVQLDYQVGELAALAYSPEQFDAMALIYAHFPANIKSQYHQTLAQYVRKGGVLIFEAFSKKHLEYVTRDERVGGPKDIGQLFSIAELQADFSDFDFRELIETEIELNEGLFHNGLGSVIRAVGVKK